MAFPNHEIYGNGEYYVSFLTKEKRHHFEYYKSPREQRKAAEYAIAQGKTNVQEGYAGMHEWERWMEIIKNGENNY